MCLLGWLFLPVIREYVVFTYIDIFRHLPHDDPRENAPTKG